MRAVLLLLGTAAGSAVLCRVAAALVARWGWMDVPNARSSHVRPTPRGGGLGILGALAPAAVAGAWLLGGPGGPTAVALAAGTVALAATGAVDDRCARGPGVKLLVQVAAAAGLVWAAGPVRSVDLPLAGAVPLGVLGPPLTVLFLAGFSNLYNFMDGTDGLAASFGGLAALSLAGIDALSGHGGIAWLGIPLGAACLGFLPVNWNPARVFMGDVGSLPVGFLLAAVAVLPSGVPFPAAFLVLTPFLFDTLFTLARRAIRREDVLSAHRSHLYQRLAATGLSHARVAALYAGWTVLSAGLGVLYLQGSALARVVALVAAAAAGAGMVIGTRARERARLGHGRVAADT